jgi:transcriptional regulator with XRE-family HTH domain
MSITPEFMAAIQKAGWRIVAADDHCVTCACGNPGCSLKIKLEPAKPIPRPWDESSVVAWERVTDADGLRRSLRNRREELGLTIPEVEEGIGLVDGHLGKIEKDYPSKIPNVMTLLWLMRCLGLAMYIAPYELPHPMLRTISATRSKIAYRRLRVKIFRELRRLKAG